MDNLDKLKPETFIKAMKILNKWKKEEPIFRAELNRKNRKNNKKTRNNS